MLSPGWRFRFLVTLTLAAGSGLYLLGARIIDRWGFGNGFAVLVGGTMAESALPAIQAAALFEDAHREALAPAVAVLALVALAPVVRCTDEEATSALVRTLPFAVLVATGAAWATGSDRFGPGYLDVLALALLGAHAWDLYAEWQARRALGDVEVAWQLHRVYAVPPALRALERAGIPTRVRGLRFRQLVHFMGPYVPIELLVPRGRGDEARRALASHAPVPHVASGDVRARPGIASAS